MKETLSQEDIERKMRESFRSKTNSIMLNSRKFENTNSGISIGLELECSLVTQECKQVEQAVRDRVVSSHGDFLDSELGASQIELRTLPIQLTEGGGFEELKEDLENKVVSLNHSANQEGVGVLHSGTNPFVPIKEIKRTDKQKYRIVPDFHNARRVSTEFIIGKEELNINDASIVSLLNSLHINMQGDNFSDAVDRTNRSFAISPMVLAVTANSRYLQLMDSFCNDVRLVAWRATHDLRDPNENRQGIPTRVDIPKKYFRSISDYFEMVSSHPFILNAPENAMEVAIGLNWSDARIKIVNDCVLIEFRPISTQATTDQDIASVIFYVGRLLWSQQTNETLLPINLVRVNREQSMEHGTKARLWTHNETGNIKLLSAKDALSLEFDRASKGLINSDIANKPLALDRLNALRQNLTQGSPAEKLHHKINSKKINRRVALRESLVEMGALRF